MNLILLGMPGSGKGTVASWLQEKYLYRQISTGDLLREERKVGTQLGKQVEVIMNEGKLVSDEMIIELVKKHIKTVGFKGVVFDGFPRTVFQAKSLDETTNIDQVIFLKVSEKIVVDRLLNRSDDSGQRREDDNERVIKERIKVYMENTQPLIDHYEKKCLLTTLDGGVSIENVRNKVKEVIESL
ncbi:adenylate kinase-like [Ylistrum balloti]|uniref:adenylate kinase-like n=1 Tax=Ylistrum balloti TaxID=509963 RepID=UPI002905DCC0|nr:adenylate kinase-like [Ylistrum balloti]